MAFRSLLFAPGNVPRRVEKAMTLAADAVILDLEDAVPISLKASARVAVAEALKQPRRITCYVRVNSLSTGWTIDDLEAVMGKHVDGIVAAKVEHPTDVEKLDWYMAHLERRHCLAPGTVDLIPLVENARGVENVLAIASAVPRVKRLVFGAVDYTADLGVQLSADTPALLYARSRVVNASRAAGLEPPIDTAYLELGNPEGLVRDASTARQLGYQGKLVIHPDQIEPVNRVFTPSDQEIAFARKVVEAFAQAEAAGHAAITLEGGKFVDYPVVHQARRLLRLAAEVSSKSN
jgi:citrate lyase subunit beta/citryl-CoA lyase